MANYWFFSVVTLGACFAAVAPARAASFCPGGAPGSFHGSSKYGDVVLASDHWSPGVHEVISDGHDGAYICGDFHTVDGVVANNIAHWDGSSWSALIDSSGGNGLTVPPLNFGCEEMRIAQDGNLYVGGGFIEAGGVAAQGVAMWDGVDWHALPLGGLDGVVRGLGLVAGHIELTGHFLRHPGGPPLSTPSYIAFDPISYTWAYPPQLPGLNEGFAIKEWAATGVTFVGGNFAAAFGHGMSANLTHSPWSPSPFYPADTAGLVLDIEPAVEGTIDSLFFAGSFTNTFGYGPFYSPGNDTRIGKLQVTGLPVPAGVADGTVFDLERDPDSSWPVVVAAVGGFNTVSGTTSRGIAWFGTLGATSGWWSLGSGLAGSVAIGEASAFVVDEGGFEDEGGYRHQTCFMVGGRFSAIDGIPAGNIGDYCCPLPRP